jgi:tRNA nucleotidyltransferase (CCA-adding enzyme)
MEIQKRLISKKAIEVCGILSAAGYEAFLVGGCIRDLLLGQIPKDYDITTNATPDQVKSVFSKTYDTGLQHGTITVIQNGEPFEITTYRSEGTYSDGRKPDSVEFVKDIKEDLSRRDLTINAIAYDPIKNEVVDPFGGMNDINDKIIKAVGNPNERFTEDGLRTMRVARFAARLGFSVDPETKSAISNSLETLSKVSKERMRDEIVKTLATSSPSTGLNILLDTGAMGIVNPALESQAVSGTFKNVDSSHGSVDTKVAILLNNLSPQEINNILTSLKFSNDEIHNVLFLRQAKDELAKFANDGSTTAARKLASFIKGITERGGGIRGKDSRKWTFEQSLSELIDFANSLSLPGADQIQKVVSEKPITMKDLAISGNDLMSTIGVKPGKRVGELLKLLYDEIVSNPEINEKDKLLDLARKFESSALHALKQITKLGIKDWWRFSDLEEKELLNTEYDFGGGLKFRAGDVPELASQIEVPAGPEEHHPEKNQLLHTNLVFQQAKKLSDDPMIWFAALLHDLGKSYTDKSKWPKQHEHEEIGVPYVEHVSNLLGVTPEWKEFAKLVAENHLKCHRSKELTTKTLRKLFDLFKNDKEKFMAFITTCEADAYGRYGGHATEPYTQKDYLIKKWEEGLAPPRQQGSTLAVSGDDLMKEFNLKPGPELGKILKILKEVAENNPDMNNKEDLMNIAKMSIGN